MCSFKVRDNKVGTKLHSLRDTGYLQVFLKILTCATPSMRLVIPIRLVTGQMLSLCCHSAIFLQYTDWTKASTFSSSHTITLPLVLAFCCSVPWEEYNSTEQTGNTQQKTIWKLSVHQEGIHVCSPCLLTRQTHFQQRVVLWTLRTKNDNTAGYVS